MKGKILMIGFTYMVMLVVQILFESLPVSSSGHMRLAGCIMQMLGIFSPLLRFEYYWLELAHIPTIGIVVVALRRRWLLLLRHIIRCRWYIIRLLWYGIIAEVMALLSYYFGLGVVHAENMPLWCGFLVTAGVLASVRWCATPYGRVPLYITYILLGIAQGLAARIPGISRLGVTYAVGRWCGLSPITSFYYSWTIAVPVYVAMCIKIISFDPHLLYMFFTYSYILCGATVGAFLLFLVTQALLVRRLESVFVVYLFSVVVVAALLHC